MADSDAFEPVEGTDNTPAKPHVDPDGQAGENPPPADNP